MEPAVPWLLCRVFYFYVYNYICNLNNSGWSCYAKIKTKRYDSYSMENEVVKAMESEDSMANSIKL